VSRYQRAESREQRSRGADDKRIREKEEKSIREEDKRTRGQEEKMTRQGTHCTPSSVSLPAGHGVDPHQP
jgi:hypothetical protein